MFWMLIYIPSNKYYFLGSNLIFFLFSREPPRYRGWWLLGMWWRSTDFKDIVLFGVNLNCEPEPEPYPCSSLDQGLSQYLGLGLIQPTNIGDLDYLRYIVSLFWIKLFLYQFPIINNTRAPGKYYWRKIIE